MIVFFPMSHILDLFVVLAKPLSVLSCSGFMKLVSWMLIFLHNGGS